MKYQDKILKLEKNGYILTSDVVKEGIPNIYLTKMVNIGVLKRVSRGIYIKSNNIIEDFVIIQSKSKNVVFSNLTSLYLLGYSNRIPIKYDATVPNNYNGELTKSNNINLFYTNKKNLRLGMINYKLQSGYMIQIYDLERSICDIIKNKNRLDAELVNKIIRNYFYGSNKDVLKLYDYAKKINVYDKVRKTFEVLS